MHAMATIEGRRAKVSGTSQVNVRMDGTLKAAGDASLAEVGLSPSDAVRALWEVMAQRGEAREQLLAALGKTGERASRKLERSRRIAAVESMAARYERLGGVAGVNPTSLPALSEEGWEELVWTDLEERREGSSHA